MTTSIYEKNVEAFGVDPVECRAVFRSIPTVED
jgi:hypothetical protein